MARLVGLVSIALGIWLLSIGLDLFSNRPGGASSDYVRVDAQITGTLESETTQGRYAPVYTVEFSDGSTRTCPLNLYSSSRPQIGRDVKLFVLKDGEPDDCGILVSQGNSSTYFILFMGFCFAAMGIVFVIKPPENTRFGDHSGGPF